MVNVNNALFWKNKNIRIYNGHILDVIQYLPDRSIQCIVSSPPYWGLRTYAGSQNSMWGGNSECEHSWNGTIGRYVRSRHGTGKTTFSPTRVHQAMHKIKEPSEVSICSKCGAYYGTFGGEPHYSIYVNNTVLLFREFKRILRDDGVIYWNIGDSYFGSNQGFGDKWASRRGALQDINDNFLGSTQHRKTVLSGKSDGIVKVKDLVGIPQRVQLALQEDGWHIRSKIMWAKCIDTVINYDEYLFNWAKKNNITQDVYAELITLIKDGILRGSTQPESVTDRPVRAYEEILMITKSTDYYWDNMAISSEFKGSTRMRTNYAVGNTTRTVNSKKSKNGMLLMKTVAEFQKMLEAPGANPRNVWAMNTSKETLELCLSCYKLYNAKEFRKLEKVNDNQRRCSCGEINWLEHFAQFPVELPSRCILSGSSENICSMCGKPYKREKKSLSIVPDCDCSAETKKSIILDPFGGSGTTGLAALKNNRNCILIDISKDYCQLMKLRIEKYLAEEKLLKENLDAESKKGNKQLQLV